MTSIRDDRREAGGGLLRAFLRNPRGIGAIAPSGAVLAQAMARGLAPGMKVLELGGGTGTLTAGILAAGVAGKDLTVLEIDAGFAAGLKARFPAARILGHSAFELETLPGIERFDAVVSGLPLVNMTAAQHAALLRGIFACTSPGGTLRQFTYRPRCPIAAATLKAARARAAYEGMALRNLPPAFVYRIERA